MTLVDQQKLLREEIQEQLNGYRRRRARDKWKAAMLKMAAVGLAGLVTVLLGIQTGDANSLTQLKNLALILAAATAVINAYDAFFDHRSLWIRRTETVAKLHELWMDFRFYSEGAKESQETVLDAGAMERFKDRLTSILQDDRREWLRLRGPDVGARRHASAPEPVARYP